jgi:hypothetical protein
MITTVITNNSLRHLQKSHEIKRWCYLQKTPAHCFLEEETDQSILSAPKRTHMHSWHTHKIHAHSQHIWWILNNMHFNIQWIKATTLFGLEVWPWTQAAFHKQWKDETRSLYNKFKAQEQNWLLERSKQLKLLVTIVVYELGNRRNNVETTT